MGHLRRILSFGDVPVPSLADDFSFPLRTGFLPLCTPTRASTSTWFDHGIWTASLSVARRLRASTRRDLLPAVEMFTEAAHGGVRVGVFSSGLPEALDFASGGGCEVSVLLPGGGERDQTRSSPPWKF